jgi:hypothetical protein
MNQTKNCHGQQKRAIQVKSGEPCGIFTSVIHYSTSARRLELGGPLLRAMTGKRRMAM